MKLSPEALYMQLGRLVAEMPNFNSMQSLGRDEYVWIGQAAALLETSGQFADAFSLKAAANKIGQSFHNRAVSEINTIMYSALARAELSAPLTVQGSFIPAGGVFDAFAAFGQAVSGAREEVLIIDPYADEKVITDFAVLVPESVHVRILADKEHVKPSLNPAYQRWHEQHGSKRPLEVRLAPKKSLHDRLIVIDGKLAWTIGQSLNAIAKRAPTSFVGVDSDTTALKAAFYDKLWADAAKL